MQNDFEKRVRQKMDELDLVPAEPVWAKIEEQIRKKKEKKRVIFWLPLLLVFLGGTAVWLNQQNNNHDNSSQLVQPASRPSVNAGKPDHITQEVSVPGSVPDHSNTKETPAGIRNKQSNTPGPTTGAAASDVRTRSSALSVTIDAVKEEPGDKNNRVISTPVSGSDEQSTENATDKPGKLIVIPADEKKPSNTEFSEKEISEKEIEKNSREDSATVLKKDSTRTSPQPLPKQNNGKWRLAVLAGGGLSGLADGLAVLSQEKMMADALGSTGSGFPTAPAVAPQPVTTSITNGFSFSIGGAAIKQLSGRFQLSAGLEYRFLSNKMQVGDDSAGYVRVYSQSLFQGTPNYQGAPNSYTNHYHFISLPVDIAFQPLKKLPLNISAGLSLQQLISTDALVYNSLYKAYEKNKSAFTQTQLFSQLGLDYSIDLKKHQLSLGPQLNYGLSKLLKNGEDKHLFSFGLRTAFIF